MISLRESWQQHTYPPGRIVQVVGTYGPAIVSADVPDPAPTLRPLSDGIRASSRLIGLDGQPRFPISSIRRLVRSFRWPTDWSYHTYFNNVEVPTAGGWTQEVQGMTYDNEYMYLVQTTSIWAIPRSPTVPVKDLGGLGERQGTWVGRYQLSSGATDGPVHLSDPSMYNGLILVPAEGIPYPVDTDDPRAVPKDAPGGGKPYMWIWAFDPRNLGLVCRIGLQSDLPSSDLALAHGGDAHLTCCTADPETRIVWVSRYGDDPNDRAVDEVYAYRLPKELDLYDSRLPSAPRGSDLPANQMEATIPTLFAEYVGRLPLYDMDSSGLDLTGVNGLAISPAGHIYIDFTRIHGKDGDDVVGIVGFDSMLGRVVRYISLGGIRAQETAQGLDVVDNGLRVVLWNDNTEGRIFEGVFLGPGGTLAAMAGSPADRFSVQGYVPPEGQEV